MNTPTIPFWLFFLFTPSMKTEQTVLFEIRHIKFGRRGIARTKEYNVTHVFDRMYILPPHLPCGLSRECYAGQLNSRKGHSKLYCWSLNNYDKTQVISSVFWMAKFQCQEQSRLEKSNARKLVCQMLAYVSLGHQYTGCFESRFTKKINTSKEICLTDPLAARSMA